MTQIVISYLTASGSQVEEEVRSDSTALDLRARDVASIDLSPLRHCVNLRELYLQKNKLRELDLSFGWDCGTG